MRREGDEEEEEDEGYKNFVQFSNIFEHTTDSKEGQKEFIISYLSPETQNSLREEIEPIKPKSLTDQREEFKEEHEQLADAFLALKEPEDPLSFKEAKELREIKFHKEQQVDELTSYVMLLLVE
mmetsp:Transcript_32166/g.31487  ORF Transcript_32166/g.31487 Transcript_32166/m.31487 type:complete len:124 (+) Transcript_32166:338-709(+)